MHLALASDPSNAENCAGRSTPIGSRPVRSRRLQFLAPIVLLFPYGRLSMRILAGIGAVAIILAVGAAVFFFGGYFNVAASAPAPGIVNWALTTTPTASIDRC